MSNGAEVGDQQNSQNWGFEKEFGLAQFKGAILYHMGIASRELNSEEEAKKYFYRAHEEWKANFVFFKASLKQQDSLILGEFKEKQKNLCTIENNSKSLVNNQLQENSSPQNKSSDRLSVQKLLRSKSDDEN